jgi:DNA topoisomerase-3
VKVCIAEKPSVAKEIAAILGASNRRDGYFEGNGYQVTWTFGHLCTLKEPHDYDSYFKRWELYTLPIIPERFGIKLIEDKGVEKQFRTIEMLVEKAEEVINCGDAGQEGELIQRWVLAKAKCNKPIKRLWISSLTEEAIKEGFLKLKDSTQFDKLYAAGSSRAIGDWLLGMNATRLYTIKYGTGKQVLSIGRVQTPTLALIVNRHLEIQNFRSATYWELKTKYRDVIFSSDKGKLNNKEEADKLLEDIKPHEFTIVSVETKKAKEAPPRLFDLTSLQVECNKKFAMSADETLKAVQSLYEKKYVTYPRVDTTYLPNDIYPKVAGILRSMRAYAPLVSALLDKPIRKSSKVFDDKKVTDHHAIIPTDVTAPVLHGHEEKVYDTIAKRFVSVFYHDCEVSNTTVMGQVKEYNFKATGRQILDQGWRVVYQKEAVTDEDQQEETQLLPAFVQGEKGPHDPVLQEKQTQPPKPYTEATLLRAMETAGKQVEDEELRDAMKDNGIGRPSTRAAVIETLFRRNYIRKERKNLVPTITGIELIQTIQNELLKSVELTGQWEYKLRQIEKGNYEAAAFLLEMKQMVSELVKQVMQEANRKITVETSAKDGSAAKDVKEGAKGTKEAKKDKEIACPKCKKGTIIKGKAAYGCTAFKEGCNFKIPFTLNGKELSDNQLTTLISKGKSPLIKGFEINGTKKSGIFILDSSFNVVFEEKEAEKKEKAPKEKQPLSCPRCKTGTIMKGNSSYGCSNWKSGCSMRLPFVFMGKELNEAQIELLVKKGETKPVKGFVNAAGEKIDGKIKLNEKWELVVL